MKKIAVLLSIASLALLASCGNNNVGEEQTWTSEVEVTVNADDTNSGVEE